MYYGPDWHKESFADSTLGDHAIAPSTIYSGLMAKLTGSYKSEVEPRINIHGAAHISGGGIPEKVGRMLRGTGLGALIDKPLDPSKIMKHAQEVTEVKNPDGSKRPMSDEEMVTTWGSGHGYVLAIDENDGDVLRSEAGNLGIKAKKIGSITKEQGISMRSRGVQSYGKLMKF